MQTNPDWHENTSSRSPDPGLDEAYLETYEAPVFLTTINLAQSEVSYNHVTPVLRFFFPRKFKIFKHWGILVRETLYELSRDPSSLALGVGLNTTCWQDVKNYHDPPLKIGITTMNDEEILAIATARFSRWPKHGYSVTYSNCQCFCYRFSWYICDNTRFRRGELDSRHLPKRLAVVQAYLLCAATITMAVGWAVWMKNLWWRFGWDTLLGVAYESALYFLFSVIYASRESLGGWHGSERLAWEPRHQFGVHALGLGLLGNFAYGPPYTHRFVAQVWKLSQTLERPDDTPHTLVQDI